MAENSSLKYYRAKKTFLSFSWRLVRFLLLIGLCFILLYPLLYMISMAFRPQSEMFDPSVIWIPKTYTMENILEVWELMKYPTALTNTLYVNIVSAFLQSAVAAVVGYGFARFQFRGKGLFFTLVIVEILIPTQLILTPLYMDFRSFDFFGILKLASWITGQNLTINLLNSPLTFYLPAVLGMGLKGGLIIFLFRQFFKGMPKEFEDAAAIDGCGFFSGFLRVMLPNSTPVVVTSLVLSSVWYWNDNLIGSMLMANHRTVMVALVNLQSQILSNMGNAAYDPYLLVTRLQAGCLLAVLPMLLVYLVVQRWFVESVQRSGIVG